MARRILRTMLAAALAASPATAEQATYGEKAAAVADPELAQITGKFVLPNGAELALSIVSDAVVDGRAVLRTVLTVDRAADLKVYARPVGAEEGPAVASAASAARAPAAATPGVAVMFDRQSGARLVSPAAGAAPAVSVATAASGVGDPAAEAAARGLQPVAVVAGGPAVATAEGPVSLAQLANGSAVALEGDRFGVLHLVGRSVAAATVNSANDRVLDSVTNVGIDLRNVTPFTTGSAIMRADALALDATARMIR